MYDCTPLNAVGSTSTTANEGHEHLASALRSSILLLAADLDVEDENL